MAERDVLKELEFMLAHQTGMAQHIDALFKLTDKNSRAIEKLFELTEKNSLSIDRVTLKLESLANVVETYIKGLRNGQQ